MASAVSLSVLQATIERALKNVPADRSRIERAAALIALGRVQRTAEAEFTVGSQNNPIAFYTVTPEGCTCVDAQRRPGQRCKHQWAARITVAAENESERQATVAARFPELSAVEMDRLAAVKRTLVAQAA